MKFLKNICGLALFIVIAIATPKTSQAQNYGYISDQEFYDELQPYGTWVYDPNYGNVWVPDAEDGFRPYATRGYWVLTPYGNTWVSDYPWGWATFHYGRWHYDDYYGWEWVPGHEWAPAWVSWRSGGGYYGWAPLTPGISINLSFGNSYNVPDYYWTCARQEYINSPQIYRYYAPRPTVVNVIHRTTIINNTYIYNNQTYVTGPRPHEIERVTHSRPVVYNINNVNRPTNEHIANNTVNIYRPAVNKAPDARPQRVVDARAYRQEHPQERIANNKEGVINHYNAQRLAQVAKNETPDSRVVKVNERPNQPARSSVPQQQEAQRQQQAQENQKRQEAQRAQQTQQQQDARRQQIENQRRQQEDAQRAQQTQQHQQQQEAQRAQQQEAQRAQQQDAQRQQVEHQRQQQQDAQRAQQTQQQQDVRRQQMEQQRQQQQEAQRAQQAQQQQDVRRQQQQEAQRAQQTQQRQQQQEAQRAQQRQQQQEAQRQQQQEAQRAQQAQQRQQQQEAQRQQQQEAQRAQQAQQRQQQQEVQRQQRPQQQRPEEQHR